MQSHVTARCSLPASQPQQLFTSHSINALRHSDICKPHLPWRCKGEHRAWSVARGALRCTSSLYTYCFPCLFCTVCITGMLQRSLCNSSLCHCLSESHGAAWGLAAQPRGTAQLAANGHHGRLEELSLWSEPAMSNIAGFQLCFLGTSAGHPTSIRYACPPTVASATNTHDL